MEKYTLLKAEDHGKISDSIRFSIKPNDFVKIGVAPEIGVEKFWVIVHKIDGNTITGEVNNDLRLTDLHGLKDTDIITFGYDNILDAILGK